MNALAAACKERGLWPFIHFNRIHVEPPLVTAVEDAHDGLDPLDEVLGIADRVVGAPAAPSCQDRHRSA